MKLDVQKSFRRQRTHGHFFPINTINKNIKTEKGIKVREYTGDMSLTKREIEATQMLVTTPEKWDVLTRKRTQDVELMNKIKLLILDEIHLLQDNRGAVIEALVARTLRLVQGFEALFLLSKTLV